jgi:anti-sigma factor RsiW
MTELSDELLVAYVDGRLAKDQKRAVAKVLDQDKVLARRVEVLKDAHQRLEAAFDAILAGAEQELMSTVPLAPPASPTQRRNGLTKLGFATAGVGLALLLLVFGFGLPERTTEIAMENGAPIPAEPAPPRAMSWHERALIAQPLLSRESVEVDPASQSNRDLVGFQLARSLGPEAKVPDLASQGLKFRRGQLLRADGKPMAQLLYLGATGGPLALYLVQGGGGGSREPVFRKEGSVRSLLWRSGGLSHLLVGEAERSHLESLVASIRAGIPEPADKKNAAPDAATEGSARISSEGSRTSPGQERGVDTIITGTN